MKCASHSFILLLFSFFDLSCYEKWPYKTVHLIGDSNIGYCFTNRYNVRPGIIRPTSVKEIKNYEHGFFDDAISKQNYLTIPYVIHWVIGRTMHRIGRDAPNGLFIPLYRVQENDVAVLSFGAIDQGGHIYRQTIKDRQVDEIIDTLVRNYLNTIQKNRGLYINLTIVIMAVLPPLIEADRLYVDEFEQAFPCQDFFKFQTKITYQLNEKLEAVSKEHGFLFLNVNSFFETTEEGLRLDRSDAHHIALPYNFIVKEQLIALLLNHKKNGKNA